MKYKTKDLEKKYSAEFFYVNHFESNFEEIYEKIKNLDEDCTIW